MSKCLQSKIKQVENVDTFNEEGCVYSSINIKEAIEIFIGKSLLLNDKNIVRQLYEELPASIFKKRNITNISNSLVSQTRNDEIQFRLKIRRLILYHLCYKYLHVVLSLKNIGNSNKSVCKYISSNVIKIPALEDADYMIYNKNSQIYVWIMVCIDYPMKINRVEGNTKNKGIIFTDAILSDVIMTENINIVAANSLKDIPIRLWELMSRSNEDSISSICTLKTIGNIKSPISSSVQSNNLRHLRCKYYERSKFN